MSSQAGSLRIWKTAKSWSPANSLTGSNESAPAKVDLWLKKTTRRARTPPRPSPHACPLLPSRVAAGQIDEVGTRSVLSLAQLLAASWVTEAHQYWGKYSLEGGHQGAAWLTHGWPEQCPQTIPLVEGRHVSKGSGGGVGWGSLEPIAGTVGGPQASNWTCAQGSRREPSECLISWHQDQP